MSQVVHMTPIEDFEPSQLDRIEAAQARIEEKLDLMLEALADEDQSDDDPPVLTLDGELAGRPRPEGESL